MEGSMVFTIDIQELMNFHMRKGADITVVYKKRVPREEETEVIVDENGKIIDALYHSEEGTKEENCLLNIYIMKRNFFEKNGKQRFDIRLGRYFPRLYLQKFYGENDLCL